jgi:hypothetical protein
MLACQSGVGSEANEKYPDTRITVQINSNGDDWKQGKAFTAFVYFLTDKQGGYPVVSAAVLGIR